MDTRQLIRVIIADDEPSIRNGLQSAIPWSELSMSVIGAAKDGMEAWELIQAHQPDIVITDIRMPRLSGLDLIKKCHDSQTTPHFIILSGYDDFSYAQTAIRYGVRIYALKPLKIQELVDELEQLKEEIEVSKKQPPAFNLEDYKSLQSSSRQLFLNLLIQNEFHHNNEICKKIKELQLKIDNSPYRILVFAFPQEHDIGTDFSSQLLKIISDIADSQKAEVWKVNSTQIALLVHLQTTDTDAEAKELAKHCLTACQNIVQGNLAVGIGSLENTLTNAYRSHSTALTALSYQLYEPGQAIYDGDIICNHPPTLSTGNIDISPLITAIRKNKQDVIKSYCQHYFHSLLYVPMPPPSFVRGMSIYLITDVQNTLRKQISSDTDLFADLPYVTINQLATFRQIEEWTTSLFVQYGESVSQYLKEQKDSIIAEAKRFIKDRINQKIQAEDVAAHVNLSSSYFTIYFKSKTGINFRDYVLHTKMEHAKYLLETQSINISEVSYAVGYDDYRSFYRAFKNHTGQTPSDYQATH